MPNSKVKILQNGIDLEKIYKNLDYEFNIRNELYLKEENVAIVSISRLHKQKNLPILIKALQYLDDNFILIIVGDGPERNRLIRLIKELKLNHRVYFLGIRFDIVNILNSSDIFILPSKIEGMSNALLEAMALKKSCIVSNIPQNKELIEDNVNGLIFKTDCEKDLSQKVLYVLKNEKNIAYGENAYQTIKSKYDINLIAKKYNKILQDMCLK